MEYVIYCRKSTDENTDKQVQSIPDQMKECMEFAEKNWLTVTKKPKDFSLFETAEEIKKQNSDESAYSRDIYRKYRSYFIVKEQKTAKHPWVRTKRVQLIKMVKQGKIKGIISYHPDRQARNMEEWGQLITLVDQGILDLKYPRFHFEPTSTGKMMLWFLFVFAKNYTDTTSENVLRGMESNVKRGKAVGKSKHGYKINDEWYHIPDWKNFDLMQQAFHMKIYEEKTNEFIGRWLYSRSFTKDNNKKVDRKNFSRIWIDPFYYGIFISGNAQSDLRLTNPYYQPMITEDEYYILSQKLKNDTRTKAIDIRDENEEINPLPKGLLKTSDWKVLSHDFPNKNTRHMPALMKLRKTNPSATLKDVVHPKHIWYKTNLVKDPKGKQLRISYEEIEKEILKTLDKAKISDSFHDEHKIYMQTLYENEQSRKSEQIRILENQRHLLQGKLTEYVGKNLWNNRSELEENVYQTEIKKRQSIIDSIDRELDNLKTNERNYIAEFTIFMGVFKTMAPRFKKLDYVRKREFIKIFISNMEINRWRKITITTFPYVEAVFGAKISNTKKDHPWAISFGADDETRTRNQLLGRQWL